jgi:replicative DNA helicase
MSTVETFVERNYRSDSVEREIAGYCCKVSSQFIGDVESTWFSNIIIANIIKLQQKLRTPISKDVLLVKLQAAKFIKKDEQELYEDEVNNLYNIKNSLLTERAFKANLETLVELYEGRQILQGMSGIIKNIKNLTVSEIKKQLQSVSAGVRQDEGINGGNYISNFQDRYDSIIKKQEMISQGISTGVPTGIRAFDALTGGLQPGEFGVIGGRSGIGKTAMLTCLGHGAWREFNKNVLFISGEMPRIDIELRIDSNLANISSSKFRMGNLSDHEMSAWRKKIEQEGEVHENFMEVVSFPRNFTAADIEGCAFNIQDKYGAPIDLILVDYINIMNPINAHGESARAWSGQADVVWELKQMIANLNDHCTLWTANQLKDEAIEADVLSLEDFKYSRAITETAPVVVGLVQTAEDRDDDVIQLQVLKMRNAELPTKAIILHPSMDKMRIYQEQVHKVKDFALYDSDEDYKALPQKKKKRKDFTKERG